MRLLLPPPPGVIPTPCLYHVLPWYPWSALPPGDGTPPRPLASPLSPPIYQWCIIAPTVPHPYTYSPGPAPFILSSPSPSQSSPTAYAHYSGPRIPPANWCCYMQLSVRGTVMPTAVARPPYWSRTIPQLPQISTVGSHVGFFVPLPACSSQRYSYVCSASPLGLDSWSARTWGGGLGVPLGSWCNTSSAGC